MALIYWDAALRGAAISLFVLVSLTFARDWRRSLTTKLGTVLTLAGACYVALIASDTLGTWGWWRLPLHLMSLSAPPLFWLFAASWFDDEFELKSWHGLFVVLTVAAGITSNYLFWGAHVRIVGLMLGWRAASIIAILLAGRAAVRGWSADLVESRRRVRLALSVAIALTILWIVVAEISVAGWPPPPGWRVANAAGMFLLAVVVALSTLGWRDPALLAAPVTPMLPAITRQETGDGPLLARLAADMTHNRLYRRDGLTITAVAARLDVPEYRLRRAINRGLGARNFNAYLNGFRLAEAEEALADPAQRGVSILIIAMDAGFGSLAPFNRAFRDQRGCTPTEYRAMKLS